MLKIDFLFEWRRMKRFLANNRKFLVSLHSYPVFVKSTSLYCVQACHSLEHRHSSRNHHHYSIRHYHNTTNINKMSELVKSTDEQQQQEESNVTASRILNFAEDKYDGATIDANTLPETDEEFNQLLDNSLQFWKSTKKRGIWLKVPIQKSSFIPIAVSKGFIFHHAEKDYLMMTTWLCTVTECRIPANATHQVGVGAIVLHDSKLLLVQERSGPLRGTGIWKMPTGLADAGEDIAAAAEREVLEETGIVAKFDKLLCLRQAHNISFGKSDLFFVCVLKPSTFEIKMQEAELVGCEWHDPKVLMDQQFFRKSPLYSIVHDLVMKEMDAQKGDGKSPPSMVHEKLPIGFRPGEQSLYYFRDNTESSDN